MQFSSCLSVWSISSPFPPKRNSKEYNISVLILTLFIVIRDKIHCVYCFYISLDQILMLCLYVMVGYILFPFLMPFSFSTHLVYKLLCFSVAYMFPIILVIWGGSVLYIQDIFQKKKTYCCVEGGNMIIVLWTLQIS